MAIFLGFGIRRTNVRGLRAVCDVEQNKQHTAKNQFKNYNGNEAAAPMRKHSTMRARLRAQALKRIVLAVANSVLANERGQK